MVEQLSSRLGELERGRRHDVVHRDTVNIYSVLTTWRYRSILKAVLPNCIQYIILDVV